MCTPYVRFLEWKLLNFCDIDCFYRIFKIISICPIVHLSKSVFVQTFFCPKVYLSNRSFVQKWANRMPYSQFNSYTYNVLPELGNIQTTNREVYKHTCNLQVAKKNLSDRLNELEILSFWREKISANSWIALNGILFHSNLCYVIHSTQPSIFRIIF